MALWHFGNSLHDVHCQFRTKERGERLYLGLRLGVEKKGDGFELYVERVTGEALKRRSRLATSSTRSTAWPRATA